jgi:iron complex outermembrane receptor protein
VFKRSIRTVVPVFFVAFACVPAGAQDVADDEVLEEVTTIARKIEERLIDVPLAITKFDAQTIESAGIRNLDDVAAFTPSLTFSNVIGEFLPVPVIRGLAPTAIFQENNAGIFVDGVYISARESMNFAQLDMASIEVVKGPVSALYGRNTFSGAIIYTTARPTADFLGKVEAQYGSDDKMMGKLVLSGPLIGDWLKGRIAALYDEWDGSYPNQAGGHRIGGYEYNTVNGSLLFNFGDSFEALLGVYWSDDQIGAPAMTSLPTNCEDRNLVNPMSRGFANFCGDLPAADDDGFAVLPTALGEDRDVLRSYLNMTFDLPGGGSIHSITGYGWTQQSFFEDGTRSGAENQPFAYQATPFGPGAPGFLRTFTTGLLQVGPGDETTEYSQELRFNSASDKDARFSVGAYFYSTEAESTGDGIIASQEKPADFFAFCPCVNIAMGPTPVGFSLGFADFAFGPWFDNPNGDIINSVIVRDKTEAYAGFASIDFDFAEKWTARAEARYTQEEKTSEDLLSGNPDFNNTWDFFTWRTNLSYKKDENTTYYASVATGEKSGGFDSANVVVPPATTPTLLVQPFDPEKNITYELGAKTGSARFQGELAVYFIDWTDIVIPQVISDIDGVPVLPFSLDVNAGDASVVGVEASMVAKLSEAWTGIIGVSWADAEYDNAIVETFREFPTYAPDGDISGNKILRQSEWKGSASLLYKTAMTENFDWFMRGDYIYQGEQFADSSNQTIVPEHAYFNARLGFESDRWHVEFWAINVFEEDSPTGAFRDVFFGNSLPNAQFPTGAFFPFRYSVSHPRLRQLGLTVRVDF